MSWSYSGDPSKSDLDECRFLIGDIDINHPIMQDEEIMYLVTNYPIKNKLYAELFKRAATLFARDIKKSLGPMSQDPTERLKFYREQAAYYSSISSISGLSIPKNHGKTIFYKGMLSNPPSPHPDKGVGYE